VNRASWHVRANSLVGAWLVAATALTLAHRWLPAAEWLMVHVLLLGAVSTAILVWSQHFADTLLRRPSWGGRRAHTARLAAHTVGAVLVVAGLVVPAFVLVLVGSVLVAAAALAQAATVVGQARGALPTRFGHLARYYVAAGAVLPFGVACGVVMARGALSDEAHGRWYVAHVALTLLGWVGLTVVGTLLVLWPTVLHARIEPSDERAGKRALPVMLVGIAMVALAAATGLRALVPVGCVVAVAGVAFVGVSMVRQARTSMPRNYAAGSVAAAVAWLAVSALAYGSVVAAAPSWDLAADRVRGLVAPFAVGFAAQVVIGSLSHLLPVVLGGGPGMARRTAAELDRGAVVRLVLVNGGLLLFVAPVPSTVRVLASFAVLGALATFLVLAARALVASRRPAPAVPLAPQATGPVHPPRVPRSGALAVGVGALALVVVLGVAADPPAAGLGTVAAASGDVVASGRTTTVTVRTERMRFSPDHIEVPAGDRLVIEVINVDTDVHDLVIETGATSGRLAAGARATVDVGVVGVDLDGWCSVAGHRLMGMTLTIGVAGSPVLADDPRPTDAAEPRHTATHGGIPAGDAAEALDLMATPADSFVAQDAALAPLPPAAGPVTHRVTLAVREVVREVAPGVRQRLWTFAGTAPGPVLHGRVGDTFVVTLVNDATIGHSIDFHAGALAPDVPMRTIAAGETLTYTFTATRSGMWMYHCSTMPMSVHIANGLFGAVVIEPADLPAVDRSYVLVQSELYLGAQDGEVDAAKVAARAPDLVAFNGYANQYRDRPLPAQVGERVRVWVLDAGPNRPSSFHVVGGQFDTVYREGDWTLRDGGSSGTGGAQVLALQPAEGGFVELAFPEPGSYAFVTHAMSDAESGALGRFRVTP
jgi:nitrite reductase (NO-forming)